MEIYAQLVIGGFLLIVLLLIGLGLKYQHQIDYLEGLFWGLLHFGAVSPLLLIDPENVIDFFGMISLIAVLSFLVRKEQNRSLGSVLGYGLEKE